MEGRLRCTQEFNKMGDQFAKVLEKVYSDMRVHISTTLESKDFAYFKISFEGIIARSNEAEEIEIDIGAICYSLEPKSNRIQELQKKINQNISEINLIKLKFKELIDMAGDISQNEKQKYLAKAETKVSAQEQNTERNLVIVPADTDGLEIVERANKSALTDMISKMNEMSVIDSCNIKLELNSSEIREPHEIRIGSLSLSIEHESEEIKQLQRDSIYHELLLKLYSSRCVEESLPDDEILLKYNNKHIKGIAIKVIAKSYKCKGFIKDNCIYECEYEDTKGSKLYGKMVKKTMFGFGCYRLANGKLFKGEILESLTACGEMIDGNVKTEGAWIIACNRDMYSFTLSGHFREFIDNRLKREGLTEGERFTGSIYEADDTVLTGVWVGSVFEEIKISKDKTVTEYKRLSTISHTETTYENSILLSRFTVTNKQKEGDAYFRTGEGEKTVRFEKGVIVWGKIKEKSENYQGSIKDGLYHGREI